ncbi:hypothetical protein EXIGLDRAFT_759790 [Exidia glandulosa HHB12029]|uniref:Uncharacterized protein n=1 Tax=Exidia glandulosa HHB12029 TaxID=1314781 RepID=A0A165PU32_EXIGL|nr:hypothetical protein EXIGLDRAFT_759790 [Exidia glandulosa HHB12029]
MLPVPHADPFSALNTVAYDPSAVALAPALPPVDPNNTATFAHNVQVAQSMAARIQQLAQNVITGVERAFEPTTDPQQTTADMQALKSMLLDFREHLAQTGVGALPLDTPPGMTEQQLAARNEVLTRTQFQRLMGPKENAEVVASMLTAPDRTR